MPKKRTDKEFRELVYKLVGNEYTVLSKYINNTTEIEIRHNVCGQIYRTKPKYFLAGSRCHSCQVKKNGLKRRLSAKEFGKRFNQLSKGEYELLTPYITCTKQIKVRHNVCGYVYKVYPQNFLAGGRCRKCFVKNEHAEKAWTTKQFKKLVFKLEDDNYEVRSKYYNNYTKIKLYHQKCGKEYYVLPSNFLEGNRCPYCKSSKGEQAIAKSLDTKSIRYKREKTFDHCINPKTRKKLQFDFYLPTYNLCIEYDGIQHQIEVNFWGGALGLKERKYRDSLKNRFCEKYQIDLLRIPYTVKNQNDINNILQKHLKVAKAKFDPEA